MKKFQVKYRAVRGGKISAKVVLTSSAEMARQIMEDALRFRPDATILSVSEVA